MAVVAVEQKIIGIDTGGLQPGMTPAASLGRKQFVGSGQH